MTPERTPERTVQVALSFALDEPSRAEFKELEQYASMIICCVFAGPESLTPEMPPEMRARAEGRFTKDELLRCAKLICDKLDKVPRKKEDSKRTWGEYVERDLLPKKTQPVPLENPGILASTQRRHSLATIPPRQDPPPLQTLLFPSPPNQYRAPILELCDRGGMPLRRRGRGAPLELRIILFATMAVRIVDRSTGLVESKRALGEWLRLLWPSDWRKISRHWPVFRECLLKVDKLKIDLPDGSEWFPLRAFHLPSNKPSLNDEVVTGVYFPEGIADGPPIDQLALSALGARNGRAFNAAVAGRSILYQLGKTWIQTPKHPFHKWGWSKNLARYPVLTLEDRRRLIFGDTESNVNRAWIDGAWNNEALAACGVIVADRQAVDRGRSVKGWQIIPSEVQ